MRKRLKNFLIMSVLFAVVTMIVYGLGEFLALIVRTKMPVALKILLGDLAFALLVSALTKPCEGSECNKKKKVDNNVDETK